ncbi:hypothetical protein TeGR_g1240, partial [Tetraparma gracilis]
SALELISLQRLDKRLLPGSSYKRLSALSSLSAFVSTAAQPRSRGGEAALLAALDLPQLLPVLAEVASGGGEEREAAFGLLEQLSHLQQHAVRARLLGEAAVVRALKARVAPLRAPAAVLCLERLLRNGAHDELKDELAGDAAFMGALKGSFRESREHLRAASSLLYALCDRVARSEAVFAFDGLMDAYLESVKEAADDEACMMLCSLSNLTPTQLWLHPSFVGAMVAVLSAEHPDGPECASEALTNLAQHVPDLMAQARPLVAAMCAPRNFPCCDWTLADIFLGGAWDPDGFDEDVELTFSHFASRPCCRGHLLVVTELLRADPSRVASTAFEGYSLTPLQLAQNGGFLDIVPVISRVAGEVGAGALAKGWSLQHALGYSEAEKSAATTCRVTAILCLQQRGWPRMLGAGEEAGAKAWRKGLQRNYADCEDTWSIILKFAF